MPHAPLNVRLAVLWLVFVSLPYFMFSNNIVWLLNRFWFGQAFALCVIAAIFLAIIKWSFLWSVINLWKILLTGFLVVAALYVVFPPSSEEYIVGMQLTSEAARLREAEIAAFVLWSPVFSVSYVAAWRRQLKQEKPSSNACA